jgi:hypothetical protein
MSEEVRMLVKTRLITDVLKDIEEQAAAVREALGSCADGNSDQLTPTTSFGITTSGGTDLLRIISLAGKLPSGGGPWSKDHEHWFQPPSLNLDTALAANNLVLTLRVSCAATAICASLQTEINAVSTWTEVFQAKGILQKSDWIHATPTPATSNFYYYEGTSPSPESLPIKLVLVVNATTHVLAEVIWLADVDTISCYFSGKVAGSYAALTFIGKNLPSPPAGGWYYYAAP